MDNIYDFLILGSHYVVRDWSRVSRSQYIPINGEVIGLILNGLNIDTLPDSFEKFKNLNWVDLSENRLETLPDSISKLKKLRRITLTNNSINSLPEFLKSLDKLETLDVEENPIVNSSEILIDIFRSSLKNKFMRNGVNEEESVYLAVIDSILSSELTDSRVGVSDPYKTYYEVDNKGHVCDLVIANHKSENQYLTELPHVICRLSYLRRLIFEGFNIQKIPECICNLVRLEALHLSNNRIKYMPSDLRCLKNLKELSLLHNLIENPPKVNENVELIIRRNPWLRTYEEISNTKFCPACEETLDLRDFPSEDALLCISCQEKKDKGYREYIDEEEEED